MVIVIAAKVSTKNVIANERKAGSIAPIRVPKYLAIAATHSRGEWVGVACESQYGSPHSGQRPMGRSPSSE